GIAECLTDEGAAVAVADLKGGIITDVTKERDVEQLCNTVMERYGRLDMFISNAGILKAGGLNEMSVEDFELVTKVNYKAFFLCAKAAARVMKEQRKEHPDRTFDIIQINSKSGLEGSNKNFAYAGSKFGGIGLVQSFALELAEYGIKVNAVCPGNYYDGPLWSDPENGLFIQYLRAGKVPGAKTVADIKAFYEAKTPIKRGCVPLDVARAIMYCAEQQYETGQAIPVTGGQVMVR
ncbi:MAG: SDR family oxidoreductase, partial [Oscillospiraceae bacterium]|nr:SDR family oxidoreductase [Oscillospiraceae bacterium]